MYLGSLCVSDNKDVIMFTTFAVQSLAPTSYWHYLMFCPTLQKQLFTKCLPPPSKAVVSVKMLTPKQNLFHNASFLVTEITEMLPNDIHTLVETHISVHSVR